MSTQTVVLEFISFEIPTHWHASLEGRDGDDQTLYLLKHISGYYGSIGVRTRCYRKTHQLPRTDKKLFEHLAQFSQSVVDRWHKQPAITPYGVISCEIEKVKVMAATFDTPRDPDEVHTSGIMRVWQLNKGRRFVFVTYHSEDWYESLQTREQELKECEAIVGSIRFRK